MKEHAGIRLIYVVNPIILQVGYLYLTNLARLEEVMLELGFSTCASTELIPLETNRKLQSQICSVPFTVLHMQIQICYFILSLWLFANKHKTSNTFVIFVEQLNILLR